MEIPGFDFNKAWALLMSEPGTVLTTLAAVVVVVGGGAWWLRHFIGNERIKALEEQLRLAQGQYASVKEQLASVEAKAAVLEREIAEVRSSLSPPARVEQLARSNTEFQSALLNLATSTSSLGHTLTFGQGQYKVMVEPITRRSD